MRSRGTLRIGFTLLELMVTLTIIAVVAVMVFPQMRNQDRLRVIAAAQIVMSDIEAAQVMTISYPEDPVVVRFDIADDSYWLAYANTPDTPLLRQPSGVPYSVTLGEGRASGAEGVNITLSNFDGSTLVFDASGGLADFTKAPMIRLKCGEAAIDLVIAPTTGTVIEQVAVEDEEEGGGALLGGEGLGGGK